MNTDIFSQDKIEFIFDMLERNIISPKTFARIGADIEDRNVFGNLRFHQSQAEHKRIAAVVSAMDEIEFHPSGEDRRAFVRRLQSELRGRQRIRS